MSFDEAFGRRASFSNQESADGEPVAHKSSLVTQKSSFLVAKDVGHRSP